MPGRRLNFWVNLQLISLASKPLQRLGSDVGGHENPGCRTWHLEFLGCECGMTSPDYSIIVTATATSVKT
jgi:hypothetical protein